MYGATQNRARLLYVTPLTLLLIVAALTPLFALTDLDVAYISRTPRYFKYASFPAGLSEPYHGGSLVLWNEGDWYNQRWPNNGDTVTFTAVIKNPGNASTGTFTYTWYIDNSPVYTSTRSSIAPGGQASITYNWTWDGPATDHTVKLVADPGGLINENIETNNYREDRTNALTYRIFVWQSVYDWFKLNINSYEPNLASFDDWIQKQVGIINTMFENSVWPTVAPNGIEEAVRIDEIVVVPDSEPSIRANHVPENMDEYDWNNPTNTWQSWDGRWGFNNEEYPQTLIENPDFLSGHFHWITHELVHMIGIHDVYQLNLWNIVNAVNPSLGHNASRETEHMNSSEWPIFSDYIAAAFNKDKHLRRDAGAGQFIYDVPTTCRVRLLDAYGNVITGTATIDFYQDWAAPGGNAWTGDACDHTSVTGSGGTLTIPNRQCYLSQSGYAEPYTTAMGHVLHDNPWGVIDTFGSNNVFYCKITVGTQVDYQFIEIIPFNKAYWQGNTSTWTYDLKTNIIPAGRPTTNNLYGIKMATSSKGYAVGATQKSLYWNGTSWANKTTPGTGYDLYAVDTYGTTTVTAYAVGSTGKVLKCTDTGSWAAVTTPYNTTLRGVAALSATTVVVGGANGKVYKSTNSGSSWPTQVTVTSNAIRSMDFFNSSVGILSCDNGQIFYSSNGGTSWTAASGSFTGNIVDCCMTSATEAWAVSSSGPIYRSTDAGHTWSVNAFLGPDNDWNAVSIASGGYGWIGGGYAENYGHAWCMRVSNYNGMNNCRMHEQTISTGSLDTIYDISSVDANNCWVVGKGGLILKLTAGTLQEP